MSSENVTFYGTGKRKNSIARVFLRNGSGKITVNKKSFALYFPTLAAQGLVKQPLTVLKLNNYDLSKLQNFDVIATVTGGGVMGQAAAIRHGISRALLQYEKNITEALPEQITVNASLENLDLTQDKPTSLSLRKILRKSGLVTRDARRVERKKVGHRKARKVEQYSKR